ncbi:MAG: extracellular solute-binding protein, partial [Chloroflexota bacterium]|nr:extracellular solute-binding protein [Chloroflexota bacterium]
MPDSESTDPKRPAPEEGSSPPVRVAATDLAILVAFCRSYIAGQRFPSPAPNNKILEELGENGLYMDRDALRGHLRNLYAKFGVEEGLTPAEKRVRLVERVYESNVIPGWGDEPSETPASLGETPTEPVHAKRQTLTRLTAGWRETGSTKLRLPGYVRDRPLAIAGLAAVLIGLSAFAIVGMSTGDTDPSPKTGRSVGKVIDPRLMSNTQGTITYCTGEDVVANRDGTTHQHEKAVKDFNDEFGPALHVNLHQFPDDATQQYERFRALQLKRSGFCDVFYSDVTWTADFAHNGWLIDLTPYVRPRLQSFVRAMREAADFNGKIWGVPKQTDAGLLFFNTDRVKDPPRTWQELYQQAAHGPRKKRLRYQGLSYEGLTVAFLEVAYAVGAEEIVMPNRKANINQPKALRA